MKPGFVPVFTALLQLTACASEPPPSPAAPAEAQMPATAASAENAASPNAATATASEPNAAPAAASSAPGASPAAATTLLPTGTPAPEVVASDVQHHEVRLSQAHGHPAVVYFYPKDGTPGCTKEACAFRDTWSKYQQKSVVLIGVSADSPQSHQQFLETHKLPFALASDESGAIAAAYGVGRGAVGYKRVTFLVDAHGKVARVWENVDPGVHAGEVLDAIAALH